MHIIKRVIHSRAVWFLAVIGWVSIAAGLWRDALSGGFSALKTVQVVLATGLATVLAGGLAVNLAWRKRGGGRQGVGRPRSD